MNNPQNAYWPTRVSHLALIALVALTPLFSLFTAEAATLSLDPNMEQLWKRTDQLVAAGTVSRTWLWGPKAFDIRQEDYIESPGGKRLVAYFDKARMELNNPNGDRTSQWFVTNGLLVKELISGQQQLGDSKFEFVEYLSANIPTAGDLDSNPNAPTYASFYGVASLAPGQNKAESRIGQSVTATLDRDGRVGQDLSYAGKVSIAAYSPELGHNIPNVFWNYFAQRGPVLGSNGQLQEAQILDWTFTMGLPITEPYWTRVKVGGQEKDVLIQAFERRVLTYTPANAPQWQVEQGNVGQHYYQWRQQNEPPLNCTNNPIRGFGKVWADNYPVRVRLGCPYSYSKEQVVQVITQRFEHGMMLWVDHTNTGEYYGPWKNTIYIMFEDGSFAQAEDTWQEGQPISSGLTPPAGKYEPQRGLGKVWRDATGLKVRERLGWAIEKEIGSNGAAQGFIRGAMFWSEKTKLIYVLYHYYNGSDVWEVYPDPFAG